MSTALYARALAEKAELEDSSVSEEQIWQQRRERSDQLLWWLEQHLQKQTCAHRPAKPAVKAFGGKGGRAAVAAELCPKCVPLVRVSWLLASQVWEFLEVECGIKPRRTYSNFRLQEQLYQGQRLILGHLRLLRDLWAGDDEGGE